MTYESHWRRLSAASDNHARPSNYMLGTDTSSEAVGADRVAFFARSAEWLAESRGYEWVQTIRLDLVTIDGRRIHYVPDAFRL